MFFAAFSADAQKLRVTGNVSSTVGETMPFFTIIIKGTTNAVVTDVNGNFSFENLSDSDTLFFGFLGFEPQLIPVKGQTEIRVKLVHKLHQLNEVMVTALGVNRQKRELGYSTERVSGVEIQQSNSPNILNALSGKTSGVQIANPDGVDGGTTRITIRGNNNISGNNQPLIVNESVQLER